MTPDECSHQDCKNRPNACLRCNGITLYRAKNKSHLRKKKSDKEGMAFQRQVKARYEKIVGKEATETLNSGALWFQPGDIMTEEFLNECKQRKLNARGEKSFTITKDIISKIEQEAGANRPGIVTFGFKGDDRIYVIADFDLWLELIQTINALKKSQ
jgi:hypothetical protein